MSKAVSGVGNAIGGVLKGAVNLVKDVGNGIGRIVKDIGSSDIGKAILIAGAVYFGGAALSGGFGASAGGGSFFSGMGAGVSSAASSLSSAWTSTLAGNFAEAGSTIGSAWTGAGNAGMATNPGWVANTGALPLTPTPAVAPAAPPPAASAMNSGAVTSGGSPLGVNLPPAAPPPPPASTSFWNSIKASPYTAPALISGGMQVGGAYIQGQAQEKQLQDQRDYEARMAKEQRDRYNANVGAPLWSSQQAPIYQSGTAAWDPYAEARARTAQIAAAGAQPQGVAARYMNPTPA
jgi:hypothetical protein